MFWPNETNVDTDINIFTITATILDNSFLVPQFKTEGFSMPFTLDQN